MKKNGCTAGHIKQANMKELLECEVVAIQEGVRKKTYELVVQAGHHVMCVDPALKPYFSSRVKSAKHHLCHAWRANDNNPGKCCVAPSTPAVPQYAFVTDFLQDTPTSSKYRGSLTIESTEGRTFPWCSCHLVRNPGDEDAPRLANQPPAGKRSFENMHEQVKRLRANYTIRYLDGARDE